MDSNRTESVMFAISDCITIQIIMDSTVHWWCYYVMHYLFPPPAEPHTLVIAQHCSWENNPKWKLLLCKHFSIILILYNTFMRRGDNSGGKSINMSTLSLSPNWDYLKLSWCSLQTMCSSAFHSWPVFCIYGNIKALTPVHLVHVASTWISATDRHLVWQQLYCCLLCLKSCAFGLDSAGLVNHFE